MEKLESVVEEKRGVLGYKTENHHYVVSLRWKDGKESEHHFPEAGFQVVDPATHEKKGFIKGKEALRILQENAPSLNEDEFSWVNFIE